MPSPWKQWYPPLLPLNPTMWCLGESVGVDGDAHSGGCYVPLGRWWLTQLSSSGCLFKFSGSDFPICFLRRLRGMGRTGSSSLALRRAKVC